jgi:hypothetical protein
MNLQPYNEGHVLDAIKAVEAVFAEAKIAPNLAGMIWVARMTYDYCAGLPWDRATDKHLRLLRTQLGLTNPEPPAPPPIFLGPLSVRDGRLWDGEKYIGWRGISEFDAIHLARTGQTDELIRRLDRAQANGCNGIRVLMMAVNLFDLAPTMLGYWVAVDAVIKSANARGLYVELVPFADTQHVMPQHQARLQYAHSVAERYGSHAGVIFGWSNEAYKNGWQSALDPALLEIVKHAPTTAPFSISDPADWVDGTGTGQPLRGELDALAKLSPILVLHAERKSPDSRFAGWVDHLKGFDEVYANPLRRYRIHDEPMGAGAEWQPGRRDNRPDAHRAAALVCAVLGIGFTYHYISAQSDATPGLDGQQLAAMIPQSPDFRFRNAGTGGACVGHFSGADKVRTCDNGAEAWAVAYGHPGALRVMEWASGWRPTVQFESASVTLYKATR